MISISVQAPGRPSTRSARLTWEGPGRPVRVAPGSTLAQLERLAVLAYLSEAKPAPPSDAEGRGEGAEDWYPTASVEGFTVALSGLAGATGIRPLWDTLEGVELETPEVTP